MGVEMVPAASLTLPVHGRLGTAPARARIALVDGAGAAALARLSAGEGEALAAATRVVVVAAGVPTVLAGIAFAEIVVAADREAALVVFARLLRGAPMGTLVQIAGSDTLIGLARRVVRDVGLPDERVETELAGSSARRVQCIHCKTVTEDVTERRIVCPGCGLELDVRDHYSRRLAAYQAVWVGPGVNTALVGGETSAS